MGDFDVESKGDAEQRDRLFVDTLAQKIDAELRNPDVNWASKRDATRDPGSDFILRRAVSGGGGDLDITSDLDMKMYDILNIDRLKFSSDNGLDTSAIKAAIFSNSDGKELYFYVPPNDPPPDNTVHEIHFQSATKQIASLSRVLASIHVPIECTDPITTSKEIRVGGPTADPTGAGSIWYKSSKLKARIASLVQDILTTGIDIDLRNYDIVNIDRLFFQSNDGLHTSNEKAHISSNLAGKELDFYVPYSPPPATVYQHHFYSGSTGIASLSRVLANFTTEVESSEKIVSGKGVEVGTRSSTDAISNEDGFVWYDSTTNELKARINGAIKVIQTEDATSTDPDAEPTTPAPFSGNVPSGAFYIPVKETVTTNLGNNNQSATTLDNRFGSLAGAIGLIRPAIINDSTDVGDIRLCWKMNHNQVSGNQYSWSGKRMDGVLMDTASPSARIRSTTGARSKQLTYVNKRINNVSQSGSQNPSSAFLLLGNIILGLWGAHSENDDLGDGSIVVLGKIVGTHPNRTVTLNYDTLGSTDELGSTSSGTGSGTVQSTGSIIPVLSLSEWPTDASTLETAFGIDDGYIGYVYSSGSSRGRIYVKANGYWFYLNLTNNLQVYNQ